MHDTDVLLEVNKNKDMNHNNNNGSKNATTVHQTIDINPELDRDCLAFQTKPLSGEEKVDSWRKRYLGWSDDFNRKSCNNYRRAVFALPLLVLLATLIFILKRTTEATRIEIRTLETKQGVFKQKLQDIRLLILDRGIEQFNTTVRNTNFYSTLL